MNEDFRNYKFQCNLSMMPAGREGGLPNANWDVCISVLSINNYASRSIFFIDSGSKYPFPTLLVKLNIRRGFKCEEIPSNLSAFFLHTIAQTQVMIRGKLTRILNSQDSSLSDGVTESGCSLDPPFSEAQREMHSS